MKSLQWSRHKPSRRYPQIDGWVAIFCIVGLGLMALGVSLPWLFPDEEELTDDFLEESWHQGRLPLEERPGLRRQAVMDKLFRVSDYSAPRLVTWTAGLVMCLVAAFGAVKGSLIR